jgi:hypothetical protein
MALDMFLLAKTGLSRTGRYRVFAALSGHAGKSLSARMTTGCLSNGKRAGFRDGGCMSTSNRWPAAITDTTPLGTPTPAAVLAGVTFVARDHRDVIEL